MTNSALNALRKFDAPLYSAWSEALEQALDPTELDAKAQAVITVALDSVVHWSQEVIEQHIHEAFDAGSSILELLEAIEHLSWLESGIHGLHDGLEALEIVIVARQNEGLAAPLTGAGLGPEDYKYEAPWPVPPVFPYHSPSPRYHNLVLAKYAPDYYKEFKTWTRARFKLRKASTRKMLELLVTACDTVIYWPEPLLDHHMHAAFEVGATAQEIVETIVLASNIVQGARETNQAGHLSEGAVYAIHHGLKALDRVLEQRASKNLLAPRDKTQPRVGAPALTSHDDGPDAVRPSMKAVEDAVRASMTEAEDSK